MFLTGDIIELAIQIEQNAEKVYRNAQKKISDPKFVVVLQWLADEETQHIQELGTLMGRDVAEEKITSET